MSDLAREKVTTLLKLHRPYLSEDDSIAVSSCMGEESWKVRGKIHLMETEAGVVHCWTRSFSQGTQVASQGWREGKEMADSPESL